MPLTIPSIDDRRYQDLLADALARIPVHTPEWTNFNESDPGVTIVEVFAFLTETLLYRANQIPERNRRKFLQLLGIGLQPSSTARGLVTFSNDRGPLETITLGGGLEVRAGSVPFRTDRGLDVLPIAAEIFYKAPMRNPPPALVDYYRQLYASFEKSLPESGGSLDMYETTAFSSRGTEAIDLEADTVDQALWIALLLREGDTASSEAARVATLAQAREVIAGKTLSLGLVPYLTDAAVRLPPGAGSLPRPEALLEFAIPSAPEHAVIQQESGPRVAAYRVLDPRSTVDVTYEPGVVELTLPRADQLTVWTDLDPLDAGTGAFPPSLDDTKLAARLITWVRVRSGASTGARLLWAGINAMSVSQRARIVGELLPPGNGEPDQAVTLSRTPVIEESVQITIAPRGGQPEVWTRIDDLFGAAPEVPVRDPRQPPGRVPRPPRHVKVFTVDPESGVVRFGDGARGARPPIDATIRADYDYGVGGEGNVGAGAIKTAPALSANVVVSNPVPTWGGAEAESVTAAEKQIPRYLQHRDRLVTAEDFAAITLRTPGVDIGRVDVLPTFHPSLDESLPGDAAGTVTLMVIPKSDPDQPDAPRPNRLFIDAVCRHLNPRRLVTTELFVRGPRYVPIYVSAGIQVEPGAAVAEVREAVKQALLKFLAPLPPTPTEELEPGTLFTAAATLKERGWPLQRPVVAMELLGVANRVGGVRLVGELLLAGDSGQPTAQMAMTGLRLPRVVGISVTVGDAVPVAQLRGDPPPDGESESTSRRFPVPVVPEECR